MTLPHPHSPKVGSTQCAITDCWGWVDDPRHLAQKPTRRKYRRSRVTARPKGPVPKLLPNVYSPKRGLRPINRKCSTCLAGADQRCWDMRSVQLYPDDKGAPTYSETRRRPHYARRLLRDDHA